MEIMRSGGGRRIRGTDEVDDCLLGRTDKPRRTHDDLNHVRRLARRALVQFDTQVAGEVVDTRMPRLKDCNSRTCRTGGSAAPAADASMYMPASTAYLHCGQMRFIRRRDSSRSNAGTAVLQCPES